MTSTSSLFLPLLLSTLLLLTAGAAARRAEFSAMRDQVNRQRVGWVAALPATINFDDEAAMKNLANSQIYSVEAMTAAFAPSIRPRLLEGEPTVAVGSLRGYPRLLPEVGDSTATNTTNATNSTNSANSTNSTNSTDANNTITVVTANNATIILSTVNSTNYVFIPYVSKVPAGYPTTLDLRTKYPNCPSISLIRSQSKCGNCWAISSMPSIADRYCIAKGVSRSFAMQDVMECCTYCTDPKVVPRNPCASGAMPYAFQFAKLTGVSTGELWDDATGCKPYFLPPGFPLTTLPNVCSDTCTNARFANTPLANLTTASQRMKIDGLRMGVGANAIIAALNAGGTVVVQMTAYKDIYLYSSGIYRSTTREVAGGHCLRVIGYGMEMGVDYWLIANSWGPAWGENGFWRVQRGINEGGMETNPFVYATFDPVPAPASAPASA